MDQITQSTEQNDLSEFWKHNLLNYCSLSLPQKTIFDSHNLQTFQSIPFRFDTSESQSMYEFSRQYNANLFSFFYLSLIQTLSALTDKQDIGITTFTHSLDPLNTMLKLSPLLIRYKLNSKLSFCEQFNQASIAVLKAYEYRNSNLEMLLSELNLSSPELFQINLCLIDQTGRNMIYLPCKETLSIPFPYHPKQAEISFSLQYTDEGICGELCYNDNRYEPNFIRTLLELFQKNLRENLQYFNK